MIAAGAALAPFVPAQTKRSTPPPSPRIYVFDCGEIKGLGVELFGFKQGEVPVRDFVVSCYLITHPRGALMFDVGVIPDSQVKAGKGGDGKSSVKRPLLDQLAEIGYTPADINYLAMSHYHSDHTANANAFAGSTWLVRKADRDFMFDEKSKGIMNPSHYSNLKTSKTTVITAKEHDVFGDGSVVLMAAEGHTPGHQVLYVKLAKSGPILIAGDLYHYPEERTMNRFPSFEFDKEKSAAARKDIDAFLAKTKAQMWIVHDKATHDKLKKAPAFYE
jgi:glyoxylase-like metal-dependent hydrolase (beta-lactamase superfamily II)